MDIFIINYKEINGQYVFFNEETEEVYQCNLPILPHIDPERFIIKVWDFEEKKNKLPSIAKTFIKSSYRLDRLQKSKFFSPIEMITKSYKSRQN